MMPAIDFSVTIAWPAVIWREAPKTNHNYDARDGYGYGRGGEGEREGGR